MLSVKAATPAAAAAVSSSEEESSEEESDDDVKPKADSSSEEESSDDDEVCPCQLWLRPRQSMATAQRRMQAMMLPVQAFHAVAACDRCPTCG